MRSLIPDQVRDRNTQRPRPAIALRDIHSLDGLRSIRAFLQCRRQLSQIEICLRREPLDRLPIHTRRAFVRPNFRPRERQRLGCEHLVHQAEPLATFDAVHQRRQHPCRPHPSFGPREHGTGLCTVRSPCGHSRCCLCLGRGLHVSTFLPPFPRPGLCCPCLSRLAPLRSYEGSVSWRARTHPPGLSASFALPSEHPTPNHDVGLDIALSVTSAHRARPHAGERLPS
jgi:hypothetical protein